MIWHALQNKKVKVIGLMGLGLFLSVLALKVFFPSQKIKTLIETKATETLGVPVKVGGVALDVFPPFSMDIKAVEIGEKQKLNTSYSFVKRVRVGVNLLKLLQKELDVRSLVVEEPFVRLSPSTEKNEPKTTPASTNSTFQMNLRRLLLKSGTLQLVDETGAVTTELAGIDEDLSALVNAQNVAQVKGVLNIERISQKLAKATFGQGVKIKLQKNFTLDLNRGDLTLSQANLFLNEFNVNIEGFAKGLLSSTPEMDFKFSGPASEVANILGFIPKALFPQMQGVSSKGQLSFEGFVKGLVDLNKTNKIEKLNYQAQLRLNNGFLSHPHLPAPVENITVSLTVDPKKIVIDKVFAKSMNSFLDLSGTVFEHQTSPKLNLQVSGDVDLAKTSQTQKDLTASGQASFKMHIKGTPEKPLAQGTVQMKNVGFVQKDFLPLEQVNGEVVLIDEQVQFNALHMKMGTSDFLIQGGLTGLLAFLNEKNPAKQNLRFHLKVSGEHLNADELLQSLSSKEEKQTQTDLSLLNPYEGTFEVSYKDALFNGLKTKNIDFVSNLKKGIFEIKKLQFGTLGGVFSILGRANYQNLNEPIFDVKLKIENASTKDFFEYASGLNKFGGVGKFLTGNVSVDTSLQGKLKQDLSLDLGSLVSKGNLKFMDAKMENYPLQNELNAFLKTDQLKSLQFSNWTQPFEIKEGGLNVNNMNVQAGNFGFVVNGNQKLDGSSHFGIDLKLPKALAQNIAEKLPSGAANLLMGGGTSLQLPLALSGTLFSPQLSLNNEKLSQSLKNQAQTQVQNKVESKVEEKKQEVVNKVLEQLPFKPKKNPKDLLKKLF